MDYMKDELADMIRFWRYDGTSNHDDVITNFINLEPEQTKNSEISVKVNFNSYNQT